MVACPILLEEGIRTLGTAVFSVQQAIAASQAGCLYISPYYNGKNYLELSHEVSVLVFIFGPELRAHQNRDFWPSSSDPALLHPFSSRLIQILETYKRIYRETGKEQPFVKHARYIINY
jgi:transaldolase